MSDEDSYYHTPLSSEKAWARIRQTRGLQAMAESVPEAAEDDHDNFLYLTGKITEGELDARVDARLLAKARNPPAEYRADIEARMRKYGIPVPPQDTTH